jgi:hypothetical protein
MFYAHYIPLVELQRTGVGVQNSWPNYRKAQRQKIRHTEFSMVHQYTQAQIYLPQ